LCCVNKTDQGVLHNVICKITMKFPWVSEILRVVAISHEIQLSIHWGVLNLFKNGNNELQILNFINICGKVLGYTENYFHDLMQSDFIMNKQTNSIALGPQENYTDWATATCRRNLLPTFVDREVLRGQCGGSPMVVNLSFLDRSHYFSFK
jgi:hypothetical protein